MAENINQMFSGLSTEMNTAVPDSFDIGINTDPAVTAVEKMAEDIRDVFSNLAADMTSVLPSKFDIDTNASISGALAADTRQTVISAPLFTVQQMVVRSEDDIRKVSQGLYDMIQTGSRAQGLFVLT